MNRKTLVLVLASFLIVNTGLIFACEYKPGETKFLDYALCRYDEDSIEVINLPEDAVWEQCIYYLEAFRPPKLLAVTREKEGKEVISINDRSQIGNPCYLTKKQCDAAMKAAGL